jgi:hypothetical protein
MQNLKRSAPVNHASPVSLIFDRSATLVTEELARLVEADEMLSPDRAPGHDLSSCRIAKYGLTFDVGVADAAANFADYRRIFVVGTLSQLQCVINIDTGPNLEAGIKIPAIAKAYLEFVAHLARALQPQIIAANYASVVSSCGYFVESVEGYCNGGPFPALATIAFHTIDNGSVIETRGVEAFASQEIRLDGNGLDEADMMRRMIRLVHEICANGPLLTGEIIQDLNADAAIHIEPTEDGRLAHASIQYGAIKNSV